MGTADLRHSTPSDEGVDSRGIAAFLDALEGDPAIRPHGMILLRHGAVIAEGWWAPYSADRVQLLYSLSKSFTSTAAGFARAERLLELDRPVIDYFPEYDAEVTDPRTRRMTVRNIASMASGHASETLDRALVAGEGNLILGFLRTPLDAEPGTIFAYNQPCTYTLAAIVQRAAGQSLVDYLRPRVFDPLGIRDAFWVEEPPGMDLGFSGLHATTDAVARLGQLYLQRGRWGETQLLDADWVAEASRVQVRNSDEWGADWGQGYGLQFWMSRHGYRGDGAYGQFCIVLPEHDMVLALTSETEEMQRVLDHVWRLLLPAVDGGTDRAADEALAARLAGRRCRCPRVAPSGCPPRTRSPRRTAPPVSGRCGCVPRGRGGRWASSTSAASSPSRSVSADGRSRPPTACRSPRPAAGRGTPSAPRCCSSRRRTPWASRAPPTARPRCGGSRSRCMRPGSASSATRSASPCSCGR